MGPLQGRVPSGRYEPEVQVDEIMLTRDTTMLEPRPMLPECMSREEPLCDEAVAPPVLCDPVEPVEPVDPVEPVEPLCDPAPADAPLGADELLIGDEPPMRPVTIT